MALTLTWREESKQSFFKKDQNAYLPSHLQQLGASGLIETFEPAQEAKVFCFLF